MAYPVAFLRLFFSQIEENVVRCFMKSYTVHGSSLVCSAVNSETQDKVCVCCHVPGPATETRENVLLYACYVPLKW